MKKVSDLLGMFLDYEKGKPILLEHHLPPKLEEKLQNEFKEFIEENDIIFKKRINYGNKV